MQQFHVKELIMQFKLSLSLAPGKERRAGCIAFARELEELLWALRQISQQHGQLQTPTCFFLYYFIYILSEN
jgi:hypothetical protein